MDDPNQSARHRIDACREVRTVSAVGPEAAPAASMDRFLIVIDLGGGEVLRFDKSKEIGPEDNNIKATKLIVEHDSDNNDADEQQLATPWGLILTTTDKSGGDSGGQPL
jgi:hypothetical protein